MFLLGKLFNRHASRVCSITLAYLVKANNKNTKIPYTDTGMDSWCKNRHAHTASKHTHMHPQFQHKAFLQTVIIQRSCPRQSFPSKKGLSNIETAHLHLHIRQPDRQIPQICVGHDRPACSLVNSGVLGAKPPRNLVKVDGGYGPRILRSVVTLIDRQVELRAIQKG
jgi:hypothetical protein